MSVNRVSKEKSLKDTTPSTPGSRVVKARTEHESIRLMVEFREALISAGLTPEQMNQVNRNMERFAGPDKNSLDISEVYAYLVIQLQFEQERADLISSSVRKKCAKVVTVDQPLTPPNMPPPPNTLSGEHRLEISLPKPEPLISPFRSKEDK